jgi:hypothetical protein
MYCRIVCVRNFWPTIVITIGFHHASTYFGTRPCWWYFMTQLSARVSHNATCGYRSCRGHFMQTNSHGTWIDWSVNGLTGRVEDNGSKQYRSLNDLWRPVHISSICWMFVNVPIHSFWWSPGEHSLSVIILSWPWRLMDKWKVLVLHSMP